MYQHQRFAVGNPQYYLTNSRCEQLNFEVNTYKNLDDLQCHGIHTELHENRLISVYITVVSN
jgi:hypothetical protein